MRVTILFALAVLAACGIDEKKGSPLGNASSNAAEAPAVSPAEAAANATVAAPPPSEVNMPTFAPQYPGSTTTAVVGAPAGGNETHEVRLATKDDAAKIFDFYRDRFTAAGLRKTSEFLSGGTGMMSAIGKGRKAAIAITKEGDHNVIIVTFSGQ